ncbi:tetratricopeptide repeat protein [Tenacibaculum sp.]|uniref:tetratricopeptide repeat protein n=1 Tax=Tenacibaculum sp. TaxID=1906242 RepID=UPI003D13F392
MLQVLPIKNFLILLVGLLSLVHVDQAITKQENIRKAIFKQLEKTEEYGLNKRFDSSRVYLEKASIIANESKEKEFVIYVNLFKSKLAYWEANTEEALEELKKIISTKNLSDSIITDAYLLYGEIYLYKKDYPKALIYHIKAEDKLEKPLPLVTKRDTGRLYQGYNRIGFIHDKLNNIKKAKEYYGKALPYVPDSNARSYMLYKIANLFKNDKEPSQALKYTIEATAIAAKNKWQLMLPTYYSNLSSYYIQKQKGDTAIYYAKKGLENNTYCRLNWLNSNLGKAYWIKKEYDKAITYFNKALRYTTADETMEVHHNLRELYAEVGKYKQAMEHNTIYLKLKDSIDNLKVKQEVYEITEKYESDKKELKIALLKKKEENNSLLIRKQKGKIWLFGVLLVSLLIITGIVIYFYKEEEKKKHLLYIKNRELIQSISSESKKKNEIIIEEEKEEEIKKAISNLIEKEFYLEKDITLAKTAKLINTNTSYLSKVINENYQKSFSNFINDLRISFMLKKLETTFEYRKLTIEHLADIAGFTSSNVFYRSFKKYTGLTPSYYIKKL